MQVTLPPSLTGLVTDHLADLKSLGFEIEEFSGDGSFVIRSVPQVLVDSDPVQAFTDVMERASQDEELKADGGFRKAFIMNLACKSAIKAGQKLSDSEIDYLVDHIKDGTFYTCPHGRPTIIRLDEDWFRNSFKRSRKY
jgi:DNA mismatch repair protein MutL